MLIVSQRPIPIVKTQFSCIYSSKTLPTPKEKSILISSSRKTTISSDLLKKKHHCSPFVHHQTQQMEGSINGSTTQSSSIFIGFSISKTIYFGLSLILRVYHRNITWFFAPLLLMVEDLHDFLNAASCMWSKLLPSRYSSHDNGDLQVVWGLKCVCVCHEKNEWHMNGI